MTADNMPAGYNARDRELLIELKGDIKNLDARLGSESRHLADKIAAVDSKTDDLKTEFEDYVRREEFWPVKALVFGMVALALGALVSALIALIVTPPGVIGGGPPL